MSGFGVRGFYSIGEVTPFRSLPAFSQALRSYELLSIWHTMICGLTKSCTCGIIILIMIKHLIIIIIIIIDIGHTPPPHAGRPAKGDPKVRGGGRVLLTEVLSARIARLASNCSTGNCSSNFAWRKSSNNSN